MKMLADYRDEFNQKLENHIKQNADNQIFRDPSEVELFDKLDKICQHLQSLDNRLSNIEQYLKYH